MLEIKAQGKDIDIDVVIPENKITVFVGLNATLKSLTARTPEALCKNKREGLLGLDNTINIVVKHNENPIDTECQHWLFVTVEDSRLILRQTINVIEDLRFAKNKLDELIKELEKGYPEELIKQVSAAVDLIRDVLNYFGINYIEKYLDLKKSADTTLAHKLYSVFEETVENTAKKLKEMVPSVNLEEWTGYTLYPLDVEIYHSPISSIEENVFDSWIAITDRRLKTRIHPRNVSSSAASHLLFKFIAMFLSQSVKYKLLVIEEPEEAMAPPQQILLTRYIQRALNVLRDYNRGETYIIITTHSPYIALGFDHKILKSYYFYYFPKRGFVAKERLPTRPFNLADLLLIAEDENRETEENP